MVDHESSSTNRGLICSACHGRPGDPAKQESVDTILEMAELKTQGNCKRLVVAGCLAERYRSDIQKEIPEIDYVFGPDQLGKILEAVHLDGDDVHRRVRDQDRREENDDQKSGEKNRRGQRNGNPRPN